MNRIIYTIGIATCGGICYYYYKGMLKNVREKDTTGENDNSDNENDPTGETDNSDEENDPTDSNESNIDLTENNLSYFTHNNVMDIEMSQTNNNVVYTLTYRRDSGLDIDSYLYENDSIPINTLDVDLGDEPDAQDVHNLRGDSCSDVVESTDDDFVDPYFTSMENWEDFRLVYSKNGSIWWITLLTFFIYLLNILLVCHLPLL